MRAGDSQCSRSDRQRAIGQGENVVICVGAVDRKRRTVSPHVTSAGQSGNGHHVISDKTRRCARLGLRTAVDRRCIVGCDRCSFGRHLNIAADHPSGACQVGARL